MSNKKKRVLFLIIINVLIIISILTGCSKSLGADKKGALVSDDENAGIKEVTLPEGIDTIFDMVILEDGTLRVATTADEKSVIYDSVDHGISWKEIYDSTNVIERTEGTKVSAYVSKNKDILWKSVKYNDDGGVQEAKYYFMRDNEINPIDIQLPEIDELKRADNEQYSWLAQSSVNNIMSCEFLEDGNLLVMDENFDLYNINVKDGTILRKYTNDYGYLLSYTTHNDTILAATNEEILSWDIESGKESENKELQEKLNRTYEQETMPLFESNILLKQSEERLYLFNNFGLFKDTDSDIEQVSDLKEKGGIELQQLYIWDVEVSQGNLYLVTANMETNKYSLYSTKAVKSKVNYEKEELTVYSLYNNQNIELAISSFQMKNPNVKVNYKVGMSGNEAATETDVIKNLNTEIMAGNGPDVFVLDDLPYQSYMEKGLLSDVSDIVKHDKYFKNLTEQFSSSDGNIMAIPSRIVLLALEGNIGIKDSSESLSGIKEYIEKNSNKSEYSELEFMQLAEFLYLSYVAPTIAEGTKFDDKLLLEYISCIKVLYEACDSPNLNDTWSDKNIEQDGVYGTANYFDWVLKDKPISFDYIDFIKLIPILNKACEVKNTKEYSLINNESEKVYISSSILGISSASEKSELAKEFLDFVMDDKMQTNDAIAGFPNNKNALKTCLQDAKHNVQVNLDETTGFEISAYTNQGAEDFVQYLEGLNTPVFTGRYIKGVVLETTRSILKGDIEINDAVKEMLEKIDIYIQE